MHVMDAIAIVTALAGCVTGVFAAWQVFRNLTKPHRELQRQIDELRGITDRHARMLDNDNRRLEERRKGEDAQARLLLQIANHLIDGNHTAELREARDEMQEFLISR